MMADADRILDELTAGIEPRGVGVAGRPDGGEVVEPLVAAAHDALEVADAIRGLVAER